MLRLPLSLLSIAFLLFSTTYAQPDPSLCTDDGPAEQDPRWHTVPSRFEIMTEFIQDKEVAELSQAFSLTRDSILLNTAEGIVKVYSNFVTNEQMNVLNRLVNNQITPFCLRQVLTSASQTSVIEPNTLKLKPSALLGFDAINKPNPYWRARYQGDGELRGIPTNLFRSCFFLNDIRATVLATYHVSDANKFQASLRRNETIILQINVTVKSQNGRQESYMYNVFRYTPNPSRFEERQALETPSGIYCPNRTSTLPVPTNIPERVSSNNEIFIPVGNMSSIFSGHNLYDTEFQYTRFDAWFSDPSGGPRWMHFTAIHDFAVGLTYNYDNARHRCTVTDITPGFLDVVPVEGSAGLVQMGTPQHLFLMDDMDYQYTGEKPCRDRIWCHVWIGEKVNADASTEQREWYWSSNINGEPVINSNPMKFVRRTYANGVMNSSFETDVFNYRRNPMTVLEIDNTLSECYRALGPAEGYNLGVLTFRIANDKKYPVLDNLNYLRFHIWETLLFSMFVRPTRISHLTVDQEMDGDKDILVTFTVLDAAPRTGPVEEPLKESSLDRIIERLSRIIDADGLTFRARYGTRQVVLRARSGSLNVPHRSTRKNERSSGPRITGLWLGLIAVGILLGGVGGFFVFGRLARK